MKRFALAILSVLVIPACSHHDDDDPDHEVTILNHGNDAAIVNIEHERASFFGGGHEDSFTYELNPGESRLDLFPSTHEVKVYITRKIDNLFLYAANVDLEDFDRHDDRVYITVNP